MLSLHCNGVNSYVFINGVGIYKFKAKDSGVNAAPLCLGNVSKKFSAGNMKKTWLFGYANDFQLIMTVLMLLIFWVFTSI